MPKSAAPRAASMPVRRGEKLRPGEAMLFGVVPGEVMK